MLDLRTMQRMLGGEIAAGRLLCPGPGHSATDRSLSIKVDNDAPGGFVVHSFAGDNPIACKDYVRQKLGLPAFKPNGSDGHRASDDAIERALMAAMSTQDRLKAHVAATYDYTDAGAELLYQVLRLEPKSFRQRRPDGNGGWLWKLDDVRRVPYRWPELMKFPDATVFVTEGEKDADRVAALGHCATCVAGNKWTEDCVQALAGRDIVILQDNDDPGQANALEAAQALCGTAKRIRVVLLPDLPDKGDVSDWLDADPRRANKLIGVCFNVPVWTPSDGAGAQSAEPKRADSKPTLPFINIAAWGDGPPPAREWTVVNRIPLRQPTLFSGEGAIGKTLVSLQLAVATVAGLDWFQALPEPGPVIYLGAEDEADELHRRLIDIAAFYNVQFSSLADLHLLSLAGKDALLATPGRDGTIKPTPLFAALLEAAIERQPRLIVLDTVSDVFAGNENDRSQVRQFVALLRRLAIEGNAGVLLLSHPSLTGINTGRGLSGSTGWHNSVRARIYLRSAATEDGEQPDAELRELQFLKNNYGPLAEKVLLRWQQGIFRLVPAAGTLEKAAADAKADNLFLDLLGRFIKQGRNVNDRSGDSYAPALFAQEPEAKAVRINRQILAQAMRRLFAANKIRIETFGRPSRPSYRLLIGPPDRHG